MELSWFLVFVTLCIQVLLISILCVPLNYLPRKIRIAIISGFEQVEAIPNLVFTMKLITGLLFVLFLDCMRSLHRLSPHPSEPGLHDLNVKLRLFRNQRNLYMSFFACFFMLVIYRLRRLFTDLHRLSNNH